METKITWTRIEKTLEQQKKSEGYSTILGKYVLYVFRSPRFRRNFIWVIFKNTKRQAFVASSERQTGLAVPYFMSFDSAANSVVKTLESIVIAGKEGVKS